MVLSLSSSPSFSLPFFLWWMDLHSPFRIIMWTLVPALVSPFLIAFSRPSQHLPQLSRWTSNWPNQVSVVEWLSYHLFFPPGARPASPPQSESPILYSHNDCWKAESGYKMLVKDRRIEYIALRICWENRSWFQECLFFFFFRLPWELSIFLLSKLFS